LSLFNELKRRNVFKVAAAYFIVAWLLLQVSDTLVPALRLPEWFHSGVAFVLILGFPVAIILAWAFELTPEGLKRDYEVDRSESTTPQTGRKLDFAIIGLLVVALGYFAYDKFAVGPGRTEQAIQIDKSIAVLPFVNMSSDVEQEYFSDGLAEEVLNLLAKIPDLRVIARTSSFSYKGKDIKIADVANELNVGHVLEGSVRKAGDQLRITAQLIRASDSSHLWSQTWDRKLEDIFAIQDEIAAEVTDQLKLTLLDGLPNVEEIDPESYALFLQARQLARLGTAERFAQSNKLYLQVLEIDPDYTAAWYGLASNYNRQALNGLLPFEEGFLMAREAANRALTIDPGYALAHTSLGWTAMLYGHDLQAAARHFQRAMVLEPGDLTVLLEASKLVGNLGRMLEAIALKEYVLARDPLNFDVYYILGLANRHAGRIDEALAAFATALRLSPGGVGLHYRLGEVQLISGEPEAAMASFKEETEGGWRMIGEVMAYYALGQKFESDTALAKLIKDYETGAAYNIAYILALRNEADRAFEWLDKAVQYNDSGLADVANEGMFANIHDDPRWLPFLESIGKSPEQLAAIEFKVTLPE